MKELPKGNRHKKVGERRIMKDKIKLVRFFRLFTTGIY
jgi:hypothetical protein